MCVCIKDCFRFLQALAAGDGFKGRNWKQQLAPVAQSSSNLNVALRSRLAVMRIKCMRARQRQVLPQQQHRVLAFTNQNGKENFPIRLPAKR